jgi:TonB family protein
MKAPLIRLSAAVLALAMASAQGQTIALLDDAPAPPLPFTATNAGSAWAISAEVSGAVSASVNALDVAIDRMTLSRPKTFDWPAEVVALDVSVTRNKEGGQWERLKTSPRYPVARTLQAGESADLPPFHLRIPLDDVQLRAGDHLTFGIIERGTHDGKTTSGYVYIQVRGALPSPATGPLTKEDVLSLLHTDAARTGAAALIARRGVLFPLDSGVTAELSAAGADAVVLDAVRAAARAPSASPVLAETAEAKRLGEEAESLWNAKNYPQALERAQAGAQAGSSAAMIVLGRIYETGNGAPKDEAASLAWFRKAADAGNPRGVNDLGNCYTFGRGVPVDLAEGLRLYRKAAEAGDAAAMSNLGSAYEAARGVPRDYAIALQWFRKSADLGHANGMNSVGLAYLTGRGTDRNYESALLWFRKAADAGSDAGRSNVGLLYETGRGVKADPAEAARWYRLAAENGHAPAMAALGHLYESGEGVPKSIAEAQLWYTKAADAGNARGMMGLGILLATGPSPDPDRAFQIFEQAAKTGSAAGMYRLALAYRAGLGTQPSAARANEYLLKAASGGSFEAVRMLAGRRAFGDPGGLPAPARATPPSVDRKIDPQYSDEARKLGVQGTVAFQLAIGEDGHITDLFVSQPLGFGLDERAVQALLRWTFRPATRDGHPAAMRARAELNFRLGGAAPTGWVPSQMAFEPGEGLTPPAFTAGSWTPGDEKNEGSAIIAFAVDKSGMARNASVLSATNPSVADRMARAVQQWRFTPAEKDGVPAEVVGRVRFVAGNGGAKFDPLFPREPELTLADLRLLIDGGLPEANLIRTVASRGVGFDLSDADARALQAAGAKDTLIQAIRANRAGPAGIPLVSASTPVAARSDPTGAAVLISKQTPKYPQGAKMARAAGVVGLRFTIGKDGIPQDISVVKPVGFGFDQAAAESLRDWRYHPATRDGQPVEVTSTVDVSFNLSDGGGTPNRRCRPVQMLFEKVPPLSAPVPVSASSAPVPGTKNGSVTLEFTLYESGIPRDIQVLHAPDPETGDAIAKSFAEWKFQGMGAAAATGRVRFVIGDGDEDSKLPLYPGTLLPEAAPANAAPPPPDSVFKAGGDVSVPSLISKANPEHSEEASKLAVSGTVVLAIVVTREGRATLSRVVKPLGFGLDQKAVDALRDWRFQPGMKDGQPVNVSAQVEVNFRSGLGAKTDWNPSGMVFDGLDPLSAPIPVSGERLTKQSPQDGRITLEFALDKTGIPGNIRILQASDPDAAGKIAKLFAGWKFRGAENGPVTGRVTFVIGNGAASGGK